MRTYVTIGNRPGVWFFSLDAASRLAVRAARLLGMPYYQARMSARAQSKTLEYESTRTHRHASAADFVASYEPTGAVFDANPGSFDHWLTERYRLYAALKPHRVVYGEVHHPPWPLQPASVELRKNTMTEQIGITLPDRSPVCHFARYQEVVAWPILPLKGESTG